MSAFVVSDAHLDALVTVAIFGVSGHTALSGRWFAPYVFNRPACVDTANRLWEMLLRENEASVNARYPAQSSITDPEFKFPLRPLYAPNISAVAALKLVACYGYQSCEHEGWDTSDAKKFCAALTSALINALPGYDAAPWAI
jgi:hypothetical protein